LKEIANHGNIQTAHNTNITLDDLNELVRTLKTEESDPIFIPHLGGRVCPSQPNLRGAWIGLSWQHSFAHLYKAVLEGVSLEYALYMNILKEDSKDFSPSEIRIIGGGGQSREWNHIKADVLGIPVVKVKREEGAPLGAALLAGYGAGLFTNLDQTAKKWISLGETILPNLNNSKYLYPKRISKYTKLINTI
jgi:xylulokinase